MLCEHGASKTAADVDGKVAADFARRRNFTMLAAWLMPSFLSEKIKSRESSLRGGSVFASLS